MKRIKEDLQALSLRIIAYLSFGLGKIHAPYSRKKLEAKHYRAIKEILKPGMVLLSFTRGELSNLFIPGFWSHAAIASSNDKVIEAIAVGVHKSDLIDFVLKKDAIVVLEPLFASREQMIQASIEADAQIGKGYDYSMVQSDIEKFYCSELVYYCYDKAVMSNPFTLRKTLGRNTVVPQDFFNAKTKFKQVWHSDDY